MTPLTPSTPLISLHNDRCLIIWGWIASVPEPLGYNTEQMFGSYGFPNLTLIQLKPWKIRLSVAGDLAALRIWQESR